MKKALSIVIFLLAGLTSTAQTFVSKHYTTNDGLPSSEVYAVFQDSKGYIWFATNFGVSRFDGYQFTNFDNTDGLPDNTIFEIYEDYKGRIWFISYSCKLSYYYNDSISLYKYNDKLLSHFRQSPVASKSSFYVDRDETVSIGIHTQGLFKINRDGVVTNDFLDYKKYPPKGYVLLRGPDKAYVISNNINHLIKINHTINFPYKNSSFDYYIKTSKTSHNLAFAIFNSLNHLLYSETNSLFEVIDKTHIKEYYFEQRIISLYEDKENFVWLGGYKNGVSGYQNGIIKTVPDIHLFKDYSVSCSLRDKEGGLWFTTLENGVYYVPSDKYFTYTEENGLSDKVVNSLLYDGVNIWAGTSGGLFKINKTQIEKINTATVNHFFIYSLYYDSAASALWLGTSMNLMKLNVRNNHLEAISPEVSSVNTILKSNNNSIWYGCPYDVVLHDSADHYTFFNIGGNSLMKIKSISFKNDSCLYVGSMDGLWELCKGRYTYLGEKNEILKNRVNNLALCNYNQTLFIATKGQGLLLFRDNKVLQIDKTKGLLSNLVTTLFIKDSVVWAATDKGLNKIVFSKHTASDYTLSSFTFNNGLVSNEINAVFVYKTTVFVGTNGGLTYFDDSKITANSIHPDIYITSFKVMDKIYPAHMVTAFSHENNYMTISFVGLNYRNLGNVNYKYKLEGASDEWIKTNFTTALFPSLSPGRYKFIVYACNESGVWSRNPAILEFIIKPPFWRTWWFYSLIIIIITAGIIFYIKQRERRLRQEKLILEQKVIERTAEVVMQKEEIEAQRDEISEQKTLVEEKNKNITDSIKYAERIQKAIIRNESELGELFPESFILFKPLDIVSGDFYWFSRKDDYIFIAVVDCTGHGVPGAFMSMLGVSFLNEIVRKKEVTSTSAVLDQLRKSIVEALQQKEQTGKRTDYASVSPGHVKDGMDIALCAINTTDHTLQFSGANIPLFMVTCAEEFAEMNPEFKARPVDIRESKSFIEIKADKQPVAIYENMKPFTNHVIRLQKGDTIYLCSDGYEDQFGGPDNKKFKIKQLKNLFMNISGLPMKEQREQLAKTFNSWQGQHNQIDDVTILGFRI